MTDSVRLTLTLLLLLTRSWYSAGLTTEDDDNDNASRSLLIRPTGKTVVRPVDTSIVFICQALDLDNDLHLKWLDEKGQEITATGRRKWVESEGIDHLKLYISPIQNADAGLYSCTGVLGDSLVQESVNLSIFKDITFDHAPSPQNPTLHTNALIECEVSGEPAPEVSWRYRGVTIENGGRYNIYNKGLRIENITEKDNGEYFCQAKVDVDGRWDSRKILVEVYVIPVVTVPPEAEGIENQETSLKCYATGTPPPQYKFYKDGNDFPVSPDDRIQVDKDNGKITFRPLVKGDEGDYICKAINYVGEDEGQGYLFVVVPPRVTELVNVSSLETESATLKCITAADPDATMSFRKVGASEDYDEGENDGGRIWVEKVSGKQLQLTINDLTPVDTSDYTCLAVNRGGDIGKNGTIVVEFAPRYQDDHIDEFYSWAGKTRNISCHVLGEPEPFIEWWRHDQILYFNETYQMYNMGKTSKLAVTIRNEDQAWIFGEYMCRASNTHGTGEQPINLLRATVPDEPKEVSAKESTATTIILEVVPPDDDGGVEIFGYRVEFENKSQDFDLDLEIKIENLRPKSTYIFRVRAKNEIGAGAPKDYAHETDQFSVPDEPKEVSAKESTATTIILEVVPPDDDGGVEIFGYRVEFENKSKDFDLDQEIKIENLRPKSTYIFRVRAKNEIGAGAPKDYAHETEQFSQRNPKPHSRHSVDNDAHFIVKMKGVKEAICFDVNGHAGDIYQLVYDRITGIIVNGRVVANDVTNNSHPDKGHVKTYFGQIAVMRRGTVVKITPSKISVGSDVYQWRDNNTIVTDNLKVKVNRRKNVIIDMGMDVVFMVMRHKRKKPHPGKVDFLGFYIQTGKGLSHSVHGLLGQFQHRSVLVMHQDGQMIEEGQQLTRLRVRGADWAGERIVEARLARRRNMEIGAHVPCWFIRNSGRGLLDVKYLDYKLSKLTSTRFALAKYVRMGRPLGD